MKLILDNKMSTYPLYKSTSKHEFGIPNIIPTREELNKKILDYYKYREIGFETVGRFLDELEIALNEIMPYYNQLFFSADQDYNVIYNVDYIRTIDRNKDNTSVSRQNSTTSANQNTTTTGNTTTYAKDISSDTPQSNISTANTDIDHVDYANNISWNKTNGSDSGYISAESFYFLNIPERECIIVSMCDKNTVFSNPAEVVEGKFACRVSVASVMVIPVLCGHQCRYSHTHANDKY